MCSNLTFTLKLHMDSLYFSLILSLMLLPLLSSSTHQTLSKGSALSVENPEDVLASPNGTFSAGFYPVGDNAYAFAIWFSKPSCHVDHCTVVWMANRDHPVNGRRSKLSLLGSGDLILTDAGQFNVWATGTASQISVQLQLNDHGNLVLRNSANTILWQSFDFPTDTLLLLQPFTGHTKLVSSRTKGNYSSGFYKFFYNDHNVLSLNFDGPDQIPTIYWPNLWFISFQGWFASNSRRNVMIDSFGNFTLSEDSTFRSTDYGASWIQRRLTIDYDGNLRLYSREERNETWVVSWQAISQPCMIHGLCGENSFCSYAPSIGRKCTCLPGFKVKNKTDSSYGCEPEFKTSLDASHDFRFIPLRNTEFYGYDFGYMENKTLKECENECLKMVDCKGFQYKFSASSFHECFPKSQLRNGHQTSSFIGDIYIKLPKAYTSNNDKALFQEMSLECQKKDTIVLERSYAKNKENGIVKFILWFASALGGVQIIAIFLIWLFLNRDTQEKNVAQEGYLLASTGFKRFTFYELKEATKNFSEEIGRGGGGVVYKGKLPDGRVAAVKRLNEANRGEAEFLAEVNTIGKLNHMNLIEMWGFCAEKMRRLLVYEYMENGSLAEKLSSNELLDGQKRYDIALGTAKGLAYLHEECLEWVLHCDVKPQNILLDSEYQPKVSDFGLSKLFDRGKLHNSSFSKIRGTRGYMAPEWVLNRPITSKVDVYSYGVVVQEMVMGMSPRDTNGEGEMELCRSVNWLEGKRKGSSSMQSWMSEIVDPMLEGNYDKKKMEILVTVALHCMEEDTNARPTMSQVVERLLDHNENEN